MAGRRQMIGLDREHREQLLALARAENSSASVLLARLVEDAYRASIETDSAARREAARHLTSMEIEDVPDPETLSQQIDGTLPLSHLSRR